MMKYNEFILAYMINVSNLYTLCTVLSWPSEIQKVYASKSRSSSFINKINKKKIPKYFK